MRRLNQAGFTLIELMIATLVFSVVLLTVTIGIIQISRVYYKGLNEIDVQNTSRTIMDSVTQGIQFSGGTVTDTPTPAIGALRTFCIGNQQYSYRLGYQLVDNSPGTNQTVSSMRVNTVADCPTAAAKTTGEEFLSPKMRLSKMSVKQITTGVYTVSIKVAYGADDLFTNPTSSDPVCKSTAGSQFCSVSELTSTVYKRVGAN